MEISQQSLIQYYGGEKFLSETRNIVFKASNYFQNTINYLQKINDEISDFNDTQLKAEIVYDDLNASNKSFYYKPTDESIKIIDDFKENLGNILKEYYHNYFFLKKYFYEFEANYSQMNKIISYSIKKSVDEKSGFFNHLYSSIKNLKNDAQRNARQSELLQDLEFLIKAMPQKENYELNISNDFFENMNMTVYQILNAVKTYDYRRIISKVDELVNQYNELLHPLRESFIEIDSFESNMFKVRADFVKLIEECDTKTEKVLGLVNNLKDNLYEKGFSQDFPCQKCDKCAINEPVVYAMNKKQLNQYLNKLKKNIINEFSGEINCSNIDEFNSYMINCFGSLKNYEIIFLPKSKDFIDSIEMDFSNKFLSYKNAPIKVKFTPKEFERFRHNVAQEVALKIEDEIKNNLEANLAKKNIKFTDIRYLEAKYLDFEEWFMKKTGLFKKNIKNNRSLEFLLEDKKDLDKQVEQDLENIEDSKENYIYKTKEYFFILRKDLRQLPEEIQNFYKEMIPSKTKISNISDEIFVKQRVKNANNLANTLNKYMNIPWLKDLGEESFINEQLVLDSLRYAFSRKKNLLYRGFDFVGDLIKESFNELSNLLADKLNITKEKLPRTELDLGFLLELKNKKPATEEDFNAILKKSKKRYCFDTDQVKEIIKKVNEAPMTAEKFYDIFKNVKEEYYLRALKKRGTSSPGDKIVSSVAVKPSFNNFYEIKYSLNDRITEPAKKFLKEKIGEPAKEFFHEKVAQPIKKYVINKWNGLKARLEAEEDDKIVLMEKIESLAYNIINPWYKRYPQLDSNTYDSLKNNENNKINAEELHSILAINSKPKFRKNLGEIALDAIDKFNESRKIPPKNIDASSNDPIILARMNDEYCRPCFETLDKKSVTLNPKELIIDEINKVFNQNNSQGFLEKTIVPMIATQINEENKIVIKKNFDKKYHCSGNYEHDPGYGFYSFLEI